MKVHFVRTKIHFRVDDEKVVKDDKKDASQPKQIDAGKEAAIEAEVKAARERAIVPLEIRMKQFRDMLAEKEVRVMTPLMQGDVLIC